LYRYTQKIPPGKGKIPQVRFADVNAPG